MKTITLYEVTANSDQTEGRGNTISTGVFFNSYNSALTFVKSDYYRKWAREGIVNRKSAQNNVRKLTMRTFDSVHDYHCNYRDLERDDKLKKILKDVSEDDIDFLNDYYAEKYSN